MPDGIAYHVYAGIVLSLGDHFKTGQRTINALERVQERERRWKDHPQRRICCATESTLLSADSVADEVWTCASVTDLIVEEFGIEYHPGHVWKILDHLGWSRQRQVLLGRRRSNSIPDRARRKSSKSSRASGDPSSVGRKLREILREDPQEMRRTADSG